MIIKRVLFSGLLTIFSFIFLFCTAQDASALKPAKKSKIIKAVKQRTAARSDVNAPPCKAAILLDAASGEVLSDLNAHEPLAPASMVKMMTAYIALKKAKEGEIHLEDQISVSSNASKMGGSQVFLRQGEVFSLQQLLEALLIQSANDAAVAIAEYISGSTLGFVELMNAEAQELGMKESSFQSPHGLPPGKDQRADLVSAFDFALLARAIITQQPEIIELTKRESGEFRNGQFIMRNHNDLLRKFQGTDGIKTGFYSEAGFCVTATALRNGVRMIAVVMGCQNKKKRADEVSRLFSLGFAQYRKVRLIEKYTSVGQSVRVAKGEQTQVIPVSAEEFSTMIKIADKPQVVQKLNLCPELIAPVVPGTPCGSMVFMLHEKELGRVKLIVKEEVRKAGLMKRIANFLLRR